MSATPRRVLITLAILAIIIAVGGWTRDQLGIELDVESVRSFAESLGPAGPLLFVFVVAGRIVLALPSQVVLIAAGLCFGTIVGTIVGGAGLMLSGLFLFLVARYAGRQSVEKRIGARGRYLLDYTTHRSGAVALGLACGYPISPLSPLHAAAGLTPMPLANFVVAAFVGGLIRASIFAYFGNALTESNLMSLVYATAVFALMMAVPLAFPKGRSWLRDIFTPARARDQDPD